MRTQLHHLVTGQAEHAPQAVAVSDKKESVSYGELADRVRRCAGGLSELGVRRGDRVAVFLDKRVDTVVAILAVSAAGAVLVPVNPVLRPAQVEHILSDSGSRVLITSPDRWGALAAARSALPTVHDLVLIGTVPDATSPAPGVTLHRWAELQSSHRSDLAGIDDDLAAILYTSGSTGRPKGVVLSHRNLIVGAESVSTYLGQTPEDVILSLLPLSFDAGFSQLTTTFATGGQVVLHNYLLPGDVPKVMATRGVTGLTCVPPLWNQIAAANWTGTAPETLRFFANTGGRMPKSLLDRLRGLFPAAAPFLMYGLTEAFRSTFLDPAEIDRRPDSIGKAIPNAEILVLRPDGEPTAPGEPGELVHRGALVAQGYWQDPERTAERFRALPSPQDSWRAAERVVWSGDTVVTDEEGFLYFVGRTDEMIKTSGYRVSPTEVEEAVLASGLVEDVVALGLPDELLGQRIEIVVAGARHDVDTDALLADLRRRLPTYMVPAAVHSVDDLPRSPNGKYDRVRIRKELTDV